MVLIINGLKIEVNLKKVKNINMTICAPNGDIKISAPKNISEGKIKNFVISKTLWIEKHRQKFLNQPKLIKNYQSGEILLLWGKEYFFKLREITSEKVKNNTIQVEDEFIVLYYKKQLTPIQRKNIINKWYRLILQEEIKKRLPIAEKTTKLKCSDWQIRDMKTRWGTCNTKTKKIWINCQLVKKPFECLDYILIHELGHIIIKNHSQDFKNYMNKFYPNWKNVRKTLNNISIENLR